MKKSFENFKEVQTFFRNNNIYVSIDTLKESFQTGYLFINVDVVFEFYQDEDSKMLILESE